MSDAATPLARATLHEALTGRIRELIVSGELAGGERVPEQRLCDQFGVSRTPLREALKVLGSEGLLELLPNRGARVATVTAADVDEIFPVMGALEALAGELACARLDDDTLAALRAAHYQMALHHRRAELQAYFELNRRIHQMILDAAGNPTLSNQYRALAARIRLVRYRADMSRARWNQAMAEHEQMLAALETRDGAVLATVLRAHVRNKQETVKASLLPALAQSVPQAVPGYD